MDEVRESESRFADEIRDAAHKLNRLIEQAMPYRIQVEVDAVEVTAIGDPVRRYIVQVQPMRIL